MISPRLVPLLSDSGPPPLAHPKEGRMPAERTTMRQVREVLRLKFVGGVPDHPIEGGDPVRPTCHRFAVNDAGASAQSTSRLHRSQDRRRVAAGQEYDHAPVTTSVRSELLLHCIARLALRDQAGGSRVFSGLHSRRYSARRAAHAVVSAPPKGRWRQACGNICSASQGIS
jgi:hypothetical protein